MIKTKREEAAVVVSFCAHRSVVHKYSDSDSQEKALLFLTSMDHIGNNFSNFLWVN